MKLKNELAKSKRTIANYRKIVTEMQKDFFKLDKGIVPSTNSGVTTLKNAGFPGKDLSTFSGADDELHSNTSGIKRGGIGNMNESFSGTEGE